MRIIAAISLLLVSLAPAADYAFGVRRMGGIPFSEAGGEEVLFPFFGGQYNTLHQLVDIDADGDLDLFLQLELDRILHFENRGSPERPDFRWNEDLGSAVKVGAWFYFTDVDKDGDFDLVTCPDGFTLAVWLNIGDKRNPRFAAPPGPLLTDADRTMQVNVFEDMNFADVDCDGDVDLFAATVLGTIRFYRNTGRLRDGMPVFEAGHEGYQGFDFSKSPKPAAKVQAAARVQKIQHGSLNTMTWVDIDGDGDQDLVYGDFYDPGLLLVVNGGTCEEPSYGDPEPLTEPGTLQTGGGNLARFGDLDGDGSIDLVVSNLNGAGWVRSGLNNDLYFFRNAEKAPRWKFERLAATPFSTVDAGSNSSVQAADVDGDGDDDLFITNRLDTGRVPSSRLFFYRNRGSAEEAAYAHESPDFLALPEETGVTLAFGDLDGDGDLDLLTGNTSGTLRRFENAGTATRPDFRQADSAYMEIDVGQKSVPTLADMDDDGDLDLLIGEARGIVKYYLNEGTASQARFSLLENKFQGIQGPIGAATAVGDVDGDGDPDLLIGGEASTSQLWINTGTRKVPQFREAVQLITQLYLAPAFSDVDADGDLDLFGGTGAGGIVLYENMGVIPYALPMAIRESGRGKRSGRPASARIGRVRSGWRILVPGRGEFDISGSRKQKEAR